MPRIFPLVTVPRNMAIVKETFGVIDPVVYGGDYGKRIWLWPWQRVAAQVYTGFVTMQVLRGEERRLHLAGGSWIDFVEAVMITQVTDILKVAYDNRFEDVDGTWYRGNLAAEALMRANINQAVQTFMAGQRIQDAIYLSGPRVSDDLNLIVPNPSSHPAFASITEKTGITMGELRFSGVRLSENYVNTMEDILLSLERLGVVRRERQDILDFLRDLVTTDPESEPTTLTAAAELFKTLSFSEFVQNISGQLVVGGPGLLTQWAWMPALMQMLGGGGAPQQEGQPRRRRRQRQPQPQGGQAQGGEGGQEGNDEE